MLNLAYSFITSKIKSIWSHPLVYRVVVYDYDTFDRIDVTDRFISYLGRSDDHINAKYRDVLRGVGVINAKNSELEITFRQPLNSDTLHTITYDGETIIFPPPRRRGFVSPKPVIVGVFMRGSASEMNITDYYHRYARAGMTPLSLFYPLIGGEPLENYSLVITYSDGAQKSYSLFEELP